MTMRTFTTLLALAWIAAAAAASSPVPLEPLVGYLAAAGGPSGSQTLFAPWHVWADGVETSLQNVTAASQEECAALCWDDPNCALFDFRSCADEAAGGSCAGAPTHTCRMFAMDCGEVMPLVFDVEPGSGDAHWTAAGFPVRNELQDAGTFEVHPGRGLLGGDLVCNESLVAGQCILASLSQTAITCGIWPDCDVVVYYSAGLDGCSAPMFRLMSTRLSSGGFLGPFTSTLTKLDNAVRFGDMAKVSEGNYTRPSAEELAAATAGTNASVGTDGSSHGRPYLGCFSGPGLLMAGTVVGMVDGMEDAGACCHACRNDTTCNVWNFCPDPAGCK
jgi:hypothetical protein